jgi:hypothetical protein
MRELPEPRSTFLGELEQLINKYSQENQSNTPDFILAGYLEDCLSAYNRALQAREKWYGRPIGHEYKHIVAAPIEPDTRKDGD